MFSRSFERNQTIINFLTTIGPRFRETARRQAAFRARKKNPRSAPNTRPLFFRTQRHAAGAHGETVLPAVHGRVRTGDRRGRGQSGRRVLRHRFPAHGVHDVARVQAATAQGTARGQTVRVPSAPVRVRRATMRGGRTTAFAPGPRRQPARHPRQRVPLNPEVGRKRVSTTSAQHLFKNNHITIVSKTVYMHLKQNLRERTLSDIDFNTIISAVFVNKAICA